MPESSNAILISLIFLGGLAGFASDRLRHDLVALLMLAACLVLGLVPATQAFTGFADPVVLTVAAVMIVSAAISRSGMLAHALRPFRRWMRARRLASRSSIRLCAV